MSAERELIPPDNQTPASPAIEVTTGPSLPRPAETIADYEQAIAQLAAIYYLRGSYPDPVEAARQHLLDAQARHT